MHSVTARTAVEVGLERFVRDGPAWSQPRRAGLLTNQSAVDHHLDHAIDLLRACEGVRLVALFGPEHGVRGSAQAGEAVTSRVDERSGLPAHSLYGATRRPAPETLQDLDILLYDVQDVGVRYATYASTLLEAMHAAADAKIGFVVLDRPNPLNGRAVQGNVLEPGHESFVGVFPLAVRHGLTVGELAALMNDRLDLGLDLTVVPLRGWRRSLWYDETGLPWVAPAPNLPTLAALTLYPGTCLIEGTTLSEGRGTTTPFEVVGAPWLNADALTRRLRAAALPGAGFRPTTFAPMFSKHAGDVCQGVHIHVIDRGRLDSAALGVYLLDEIRDLHPDEFQWLPAREGSAPFIDLLAGGPALRHALDAATPAADIVASWRADHARVARLCAPYLLYPE